MIIARTPFRISFVGGGSDLREFYRESPGMVISTTINKYLYVAIHPYFEVGRTFIKYSKTENVSSVSEIEHPIIREILSEYNVSGVDITSISDILAGTGLGSSSSYTVGVLHALNAFFGKFIPKEILAAKACQIEIDKVGSPIGKQDQYAVTYGGFNSITFNPDETVNVEPIITSREIKKLFEENLLLFYVGKTRSANEILKLQEHNIKNFREKRDNISRIVHFAISFKDALCQGNLLDCGKILHETWMLKREMAKGVSNQEIDSYYDLALESGAIGGKLLGAGGGGFLLFYCEKEKQPQVISALSALRHYQFNFDPFGSKIIHME